MKIRWIDSFNKRELSLIGIALVIGLILGNFVFQEDGQKHAGHHHEMESEDDVIWTCSMHPQIRQNKPGLCPICAMDLVPVKTSQSTDAGIDPNEIQMTESAMKLADIQTYTVERGMPVRSIHLLGKVKADERNIAELTARFGGRIEKLFINYTGQNVTKGQKLGTIYSPDLITAQKELLEAIRYKNSNPAFYRASRNKLKLWDLSESQIQTIESDNEPRLFFDVLAPISGTVTKRHVAAGDYVKEGSPLFQVIDLKAVWIMFEAYEVDLPWLRVGDRLTYTIQSLPGKTFSSKVSFIDPFINAATRIARVRIEAPNTNLILKPEMFAAGIVESRIAESTNELLIPKSSILWTGKKAVVYIKVPNRETPSFLYREIILGPEASNFYVVSEGLSEGEEIAIHGVFKIDASAQLAGKTSMMNPSEGSNVTGHLQSGTKPGQVNTIHETHPAHAANLSHETFKVSGSCGMCKERIEDTALGLSGVNSASWNSESNKLNVSFNADRINLRDIHIAIAKVGHDTELESAPDDVYDDLPNCCKYTRE